MKCPHDPEHFAHGIGFARRDPPVYGRPAEIMGGTPIERVSDPNAENPPVIAAAALFIFGFGLFMLCRRSDFLPCVPWMIIVAPRLILRFSRALWSWLAASINHVWERGFAVRPTAITTAALALVFGTPGLAVENGFTHVRTTYDGISYAVEPYGRILGQMNRGVGEADIMYVDVPTEGVRTVYVRFGDWLGWPSVILVGLFSVSAIVFGGGAPGTHSLAARN